jgi:hypothetical protein
VTPRVACIEFFCVAQTWETSYEVCRTLLRQCWWVYRQSSEFIHCKKFRFRLGMVVTFFFLLLPFRSFVYWEFSSAQPRLHKGAGINIINVTSYSTAVLMLLRTRWNGIECNKVLLLFFFLTRFPSLSIDFFRRVSLYEGLSIFCRMQNPVPTTELACSTSRHIPCFSHPEHN